MPRVGDQDICDSYDRETNECMRRLDRCDCNPPRCICGKFTSSWDKLCSIACEENMQAEYEAQEISDITYDWHV